MTNIYLSKITEIGSDASLFFNENMLILFNETALPELRDIAVVHEVAELKLDINLNDELVIDNQVYKVTGIGDKVNETMRELGHCTVVFNGETNPELPGTLCVEAKPIPNIMVSNSIQIRTTEGAY